MSKMYKTVKRLYSQGLWKKYRVHDAVGKGWITADEYKDITGEGYVEE